MKTLKQIREEHDSNYTDQIEHLSEKVMLEDKPRDVIPSPKEMPSLLIFRRVSFRSYPKGQVVALYYSKTLDKYLSIPFGPGGNLNLSESSVYDTMEELDIAEGAKWDAVKGGAKGAVSGAIKGAALGTAIGHAPGTAAGAVVGGAVGAYKGAKKAYGKSKDINEAGGALGAIASLAKNVVGGALSGYTGAAGRMGDVDKDSSINRETKRLSDPKARIKSSWSKKSETEPGPVYQSKLRQAAVAPIKENKISDIRNMINEETDNMDLHINGRTVTLNTSMAKRILEVYDSVNTKNKKIVESMLNEDLESFKKLLNFSVRN